jgi:ureidoacrylate peracid hydrolase
MTGAPERLLIPPRASDGPPGYGHALQIEPAHTVVVVVDVQRYFVDSLPFAAMGRIVEPTARFLSVARAAGILVVHVRSAFRPDMGDAGRPGSRTRQMMDSAGPGLVDGTPGAEIVPALAPQSDDLVVIKKGFSGFSETTLHDLLAARGVDTLLFAGGTTTVCVESTLRDAMFLGYNCVLLSDCTADLDDALYESALARIDMFFGWVCASTDLAAGLTGSSATRPRL